MELVSCTGKQRPGAQGAAKGIRVYYARAVAGYMEAMHYGWKVHVERSRLKVF